ncbi:hypothetical protein [Roseovarius sp. D22-M7]|uniref:hypothetical protein n=1 Tax=Roseovarius sp. D22-M7 TaxID=3127116 RepID=UPI003FA71E80
MIEIENVTKIFGTGPEGFTARDDVSVTISSNEFFTLLGAAAGPRFCASSPASSTPAAARSRSTARIF